LIKIILISFLTLMAFVGNVLAEPYKSKELPSDELLINTIKNYYIWNKKTSRHPGQEFHRLLKKEEIDNNVYRITVDMTEYVWNQACRHNADIILKKLNSDSWIINLNKSHVLEVPPRTNFD
jgi:hypothetical protein